MTNAPREHRRVQPVPLTAILKLEGWYVWGGSMVQTPDGRCHLLYARWPTYKGFHAWVTHSEIAYASADTPLGPYRHVSVALPERGEDYWDGHCTHNPTVVAADGRYYLYYMGNQGDRQQWEGLNWTHRNNQRIGVAVADHPSGPWQRRDDPVVDVTPGYADALCCSNPSVTQRPDGGFLMVYKAVGDSAPLPFGGPVLHIAARADSPFGPFNKHPHPVFYKKGVHFAAEDPFIWQQGGRYYAIVKDQKGYFANTGRSLVLFASSDGLNWNLTPAPLVCRTEIIWEDGQRQAVQALERPQLWLKNGTPAVLFCACRPDPDVPYTFNVHMPVEIEMDL
jgi:hypothetical protein